MTIWKVGMLAVCIPGPGWTSSENPDDHIGPLPREVVRVRSTDLWCGRLCLRFEEYRCADDLFDASEFRPLVSDEDDAELIARIKACKPIREPLSTGLLPTHAPVDHPRANVPTSAGVETVSRSHFDGGQGPDARHHTLSQFPNGEAIVPLHDGANI